MTFIDVSRYSSVEAAVQELQPQAREEGITLFFPARADEYLLNEQGAANPGSILLTGPRTQLIGEGPEASVLRCTARTASPAIGINMGDDGKRTDQFAVRDLQLKGADVSDIPPRQRGESLWDWLVRWSQELDSYPAVGIQVGGASDAPRSASGVFHNARITGFKAAGVETVATVMNTFYHVLFYANGVGFSTRSMRYEEPEGPRRTVNNANQFFGCRFIKNVKYGLFLTGLANGNLFQGCQFEQNGHFGAMLAGAPVQIIEVLAPPPDSLEGIGFYNCWFEANHGAHLGIQAHKSSDLSFVIQNCIFNKVLPQPNGSALEPVHILISEHVSKALIGPNAHRSEHRHVRSEQATGKLMALGVTESEREQWEVVESPLLEISWMG